MGVMCLLWLVALAAVATGPSGGVIQFLIQPATAAWVQAVGSIGAIFASALFVRWQVDLAHARELERIAEQALQDRRQLRARAVGLAVLAVNRIAIVERLLRLDGRRADFASLALSIEVDLNAMRDFPIWQLPNGEAMTKFSTFPGTLAAALKAIRTLESFKIASSIPQDKLDTALGILAELITNAGKRGNELREILDDYVSHGRLQRPQPPASPLAAPAPEGSAPLRP